MKNKSLFTIILIFFAFCFFIFLKSLKNSNIYIPPQNLDKKLIAFNTTTLFDSKIISSKDLFVEDKIYLLNLWASWCAPCRLEHKNLMTLSNNKSIKIIGLNYRDSLVNAKNFINKFGNPYSEILTDKDGTIAINLGAIGVPETYVINKNKKILKKITGPINSKHMKEIESLLLK